MDPLGIDFLKDRYDFELKRKDQLTEALTLPVGVLTVLGGLLGAMAQSFSYGTDAATHVFIVFVVISVIAFTTLSLLLGACLPVVRVPAHAAEFGRCTVRHPALVAESSVLSDAHATHRHRRF